MYGYELVGGGYGIDYPSPITMKVIAYLARIFNFRLYGCEYTDRAEECAFGKYPDPDVIHIRKGQITAFYL